VLLPAAQCLAPRSEQDRAKSAAIESIRQSYKTQFHQEAVMRVDGMTCVAF